MKELGVTSNPNYKISYFYDYNACITVSTQKHGVVKVKPLEVIWQQHPEFATPANTIMFDDIRE